MNDNHILQHIQITAQKQKRNIASLMRLSHDDEFNSILKKQYLQFNTLVANVSDLLVSRGVAPKNTISCTKKSFLISNKKNSTQHTNNLIQKTTSHLEKHSKKMKQYHGKNQNVLDLSNNLCQIEANMLDDLKTFL